MLDQRRRRWADIETALGECPVFAGLLRGSMKWIINECASSVRNNRSDSTILQRQKTVSDHLWSEQILHFGLHEQTNDMEKWHEPHYSLSGEMLPCIVIRSWKWNESGTFVHTQAKLDQENLLRMVRWVRQNCPPDTGLEIQTLDVWGRARYHLVTEAPSNTEFYERMGE